MNCDGTDCRATYQYSPSAAKMANCWGNVFASNVQSADFNAYGCKDLNGANGTAVPTNGTAYVGALQA